MALADIDSDSVSHRHPSLYLRQALRLPRQPPPWWPPLAVTVKARSRWSMPASHDESAPARQLAGRDGGRGTLPWTRRTCPWNFNLVCKLSSRDRRRRVPTQANTAEPAASVSLTAHCSTGGVSFFAGVRFSSCRSPPPVTVSESQLPSATVPYIVMPNAACPQYLAR